MARDWKPWDRGERIDTMLLRARVEAMVCAGYSLAEAGRELGITRERVRQLHPDHGLPRGCTREGALSPLDVRRAKELCAAGLTVAEAGDLFGVSGTTTRRCVALGVRHTGWRAARAKSEVADCLLVAMLADGATVNEAAEVLGEFQSATARRLARMRRRGLKLPLLWAGQGGAPKALGLTAEG